MLAFYVNRRKDLNWEFPLANNCCLQELRHTHISYTSDLRQILHFFFGNFNSNFSQIGIFNSNFSQSGVLVVPLTRQAATQGSKQFEVNNCQQALIFCQYPFRYFIPDLFQNLCPSETEDKKVLSRSVKGTCQRGPGRHRHSYW